MTRIPFALPALAAAALLAPPAARAYHVDQILNVGGPGGWDYVTVDSPHNLIYLPRGNHTQVVDGKDGVVVADIPGQNHNHGVVLVPALGRGFISDGEDGCVVLFDLKSYKILGKIKAADDADGIIYDKATKRVFVGCGDSGQLIAIAANVDPANGSAEPAVDLGGKPEFLATDYKGRIFVNLADKDLVAVVDAQTLKVLAKWPTAPGGEPTGLGIDRKAGVLLVGCRNPQKLIVMSTTDGKIVADLPIGAGVDAVKFDSGKAFASCRDGTLTVAAPDASGAWSVVETVTTKPGARTMGVNERTHALYLPTAEFEPGGGKRPKMKPDTFMLVVVKP